MFIFFFRKLYIIPTFSSKKDITIIYNILQPSHPLHPNKNHLQWSQLTLQTQASVDLTTAPRLWSVSTPAIRFRSSSWETTEAGFEKLIQAGFHRIFNVSFEFSDLCFFYCLLISSHLIYRGVSIWCFLICCIRFPWQERTLDHRPSLQGELPPLPFGKNSWGAASEVLVSFQVL